MPNYITSTVIDLRTIKCFVTIRNPAPCTVIATFFPGKARPLEKPIEFAKKALLLRSAHLAFILLLYKKGCIANRALEPTRDWLLVLAFAKVMQPSILTKNSRFLASCVYFCCHCSWSLFIANFNLINRYNIQVFYRKWYPLHIWRPGTRSSWSNQVESMG